MIEDCREVIGMNNEKPGGRARTEMVEMTAPAGQATEVVFACSSQCDERPVLHALNFVL